MLDAESSPKWTIRAENPDAGFAGPVLYGSVPAEAAQVFPEEGAPEPFDFADAVLIWIDRYDDSGTRQVGCAAVNAECPE